MTNYKLAPAMSHLSQLILATLPLLGVLIYFLYLAAVRKNSAYYNPPNNMNDDAINALIESEGPQIDLMKMVYVFLAFFLFWLTAAIYVSVYIPKRRRLISSYVKEGKTVIGDVRYLPRKGLRFFCSMCKRFAPEYAAVTYRHHPEDSSSSSGSKSSKLDPDKSWVVTKRVRTYQPYSREKVSILVLPGLPKSGQPKTDVEIDYATFSENAQGIRDRTRGVLMVMIFWVVFTLLGSFFVLHQMEQLNDPNLPYKYGLWFTLVFVLVVTPLVAVGGNYARWAMYRRYIVRAGKYVEEGTDGDIKVRPSYEDDEPGCDGGVCHATMCAGGDGMDDSVADGNSTAYYKEMA